MSDFKSIEEINRERTKKSSEIFKKKHEKHVIFSIDLKSFYASVECVERNLDPFKTPLVVCDKDRGVNTIILAVSPYLKKERGIPNRLRLKELPSDIPNLIYAKPRMELYMKKSAEVISVILDFVEYSDMHIYSIDECFIDVTHYLKQAKCTPFEYAKKILKAIKDKTKLTCSCGIGENIFMAKCAMDVEGKHSPSLIGEWTYDDIPSKLWDVSPLSKMWGIGSRLEKRLNDLGFYTIGDIAISPIGYVKEKLGVIGEEIYNHSHGRDDAIIGDIYTPESTSLSCGQVLFRDYNYIEMETIVKDMAEELCEKLRKEQKQAKGLSLFIVYSKDIGGFGKSMVLSRPTLSVSEVSSKLLYIYRSFVQDLPIRRIGVSAFNLSSSSLQQMDMFTDFSKYDEELKFNTLLDEIKHTFGKNSAYKMTAASKNSNAISRNSQIGGHNKE